MHLNRKSYRLPIALEPSRTEGPNGYLLRLAEENLLSLPQLSQMGIAYDISILRANEFLPNEHLNAELHAYVNHISYFKQNATNVFVEKGARYCPLCLQDHHQWRVEWELYFYDVCHIHQVWLLDQCTSCGKKLDWSRTHLTRCACGATLQYEDVRQAPQSLVDLSNVMSQKILLPDGPIKFLRPLELADIQQTQKLIRYLGNYMAAAPGRNPLKMKDAGDLNHSWSVTTLAAEHLNNWPEGFHQALTHLERRNRSDGRPSLNDAFGSAYHYVFNNMRDAAFREVRTQFELWISAEWRGGVARRNKRLINVMLEDASWIPAMAACDYLGISLQRLELLIREGTIEGETHISEKGRKFTMVRRDNLEAVKDQLFGMIDMNTAKDILGLQKRRMRQLLTLLFRDVKKIGSTAGAPWAISRQEVNQIIDLAVDVPVVSIPDEDCVSFGHVLKYWTWTNQEIADFLIAVKKKEVLIINQLDTDRGVAAWNFRLDALKNWHVRLHQGLTEWLTISQAAKLLGTKEQVAYELVKLGFLPVEIMPYQKKRGSRVRRSAIETFNEHYIFATKIAEQFNRSYRWVLSSLERHHIRPISGPGIDGSRQNLYRREPLLDSILQGEQSTLLLMD